MTNAQDNIVGGETDVIGQAPGNTILGNGVGVAISTTGAEGNIIQGNVIANSQGFISSGGGRGYGVEIIGSAANNQIGGNEKKDANSIHDNAAAGVFIDTGTGNAILHNQIFSNGALGGGLGIDLNTDLREPNQPPLTSSVGANNLQNYPVLYSATAGGSHEVEALLYSAANTTYTIEIFDGTTSVQDKDDAESFVGSATVTTNASGIALANIALPDNAATVGTFLIATATDPNGNTSEFSFPTPVLADSDGDGVPDVLESDGPNGGDANGDGIPDNQEANVATVQSAGSDPGFITLVATAGTTLENVRSLVNPSPNDAPPHSLFPFGFVDFTLTGLSPGAHVTVQMTLPGAAPLYYWRFGPTPDDPSPHWFDWLYDKQTDTGAEINGNSITLHFVDGARGDEDLTANGVIQDAGGPGFADPFTVTNTSDSGEGSLRQAILNANANPGQDEITFDIQGSGPHTIQPLSALPAITDSVIIDGLKQPPSEAGYDIEATTPLIELDGSQAGPGVDGLTIDSGNATIQGLVINRFSGAGIRIEASGSGEIDGNYIGTDISGAVARGNGSFGIVIDTAASNSGEVNFIGNRQPNDRNIISGNAAGGILIEGSQASLTVVESNYIGTQVDGVSPLGNGGPGILLNDGASSNNIGTGLPDQGNSIAFNAGAGVEILAAQGYLIEANSIFANGGLGIDLGGDGVTPNDPGDSDGLQNYPVLSHVASYGGLTYITGTLSSTPNSSFTLAFYTSATADPTGFGEGQSLLTSQSVNTDASGLATFDFGFLATVAPGSFITSTASLAGRGTSEFSAAIKLPASEVLTFTVNTTDDVNDAVPDPAHFSLREAILAANSHPGQDIIRFDLPGVDRTIAPLSPLPEITDPVIIDGTTQPGFAGLPLIELDARRRAPGLTGW